jgi:heptosyltransferase-1
MPSHLIPGRKAPVFDPAGLSRVLIIKMSSIGDVVHAMPVASALRRTYPNLRITWLVEDWLAPLLQRHQAIDRLITLPALRWPLSGPALLRLRQAIRELRSESYDAAVDLHGLLKSSVMSVLSRAPVRIGTDYQREGAHLFSYGVPSYSPTTNVVEEYLSSARFLGANTDQVVFDLHPDGPELSSVRAMLARSAVPAALPLIVINPAASVPWKDWAAERWVAVARALSENGRVIVIGLRRHRDRNAAIARAAGALDLTGETSLAELIALLSIASLHIAPDTGSAHIAAALSTPVIGIYGPTVASRSAPYGQIDRTLWGGERCAPLCPRRCPNNLACLDSISADDVVAKARRIFRERAPSLAQNGA